MQRLHHLMSDDLRADLDEMLRQAFEALTGLYELHRWQL